MLSYNNSEAATIDDVIQKRVDSAASRNSSIVMDNHINIPEWMLKSTPLRMLATS